MPPSSSRSHTERLLGNYYQENYPPSPPNLLVIYFPSVDNSDDNFTSPTSALAADACNDTEGVFNVALSQSLFVHLQRQLKVLKVFK